MTHCQDITLSHLKGVFPHIFINLKKKVIYYRAFMSFHILIDLDLFVPFCTCSCLSASFRQGSRDSHRLKTPDVDLDLDLGSKYIDLGL